MTLSRVIVIVAVGVLIFGCSTDNTPTGTGNNNTGPVVYIYADTAHYQLTFAVLSDSRAFPEPVVNWEQSLGEPFTDVNGNGVFDPGIDGFITCLSPDSNQDLNRNNKYDGPDDPWEPGIPFDDIDGNGLFRQNPNNPYINYETGLPFADFNLNGQRDSALGFFTALTEFKATVGLDGSIWYRTGPRPPGVYFGYRFLSDSGRVYDLSYLASSDIQDIVDFVATDSGLLYRAAPGIYWNVIPLIVLDTGEVVDGAVNEILVDYPEDPFNDTLRFTRTVAYDTSLIVYGYSFPHIIKVSLDAGVIGCDFYLSLERRLLGYGQWIADTTPESYGRSSAYYYYVDSLEKTDSIFLPMTR